ncbi:dynamin family protein [Pseudomonas berkeleyensis]|uniref:Dynamin family protein n=1 Tax=Pseudomonas berkeleyensis TaxID=2726956 RepID=A0A7G5DMD6_9PSED|nr:dynamin family protein [Pseudomonas berkeleyensis]QMV62911.1 dynamin family protein [Pseudomonas berkeleyensis]WSO38365.1 dynamin family protein [Pseudomonas berkeleyensis]
MLKAQKHLLNLLHNTRELTEKIKANSVSIPDEPQSTLELQEAIQNRELLIPVVGAFSAGKSTLLNTIIGRKILPTDIRPETAIPSELRYASTERLEALFNDGHSEEFPLDQLSMIQSRAAELQLVRVYIDSPSLKVLHPLVLVDMPGFNSPLDAHNKAIAHYIGKGCHYLFVVSVEEGSLHKQILRNMDEVSHLGRSFSVCLNKTDLKPLSDVQGISDYIIEQLEDEGLPSIVCTVSQSDNADIEHMLSDIEPDELFRSLFLPVLQQHNLALDNLLSTALGSLQNDQASNTRKINDLEQALHGLEKERDRQHQAARNGNLDEQVNNVLHHVRNQLAGAIDDMARAALRSQDDLSRIISDEVRSSLTSSLKLATDGISAQMVQDFCQRTNNTLDCQLHLSQNWTDSLLSTLQAQLLPNLLSMLDSKQSRLPTGALTTISIAAGRFIPIPILQVATALLPSILGGIFGRISEGQKLEQAKTTIRDQLLPDVERRLRPEIATFLSQAQEQALGMLADAFDKQIKAQKDVLEQLNQEASAANREALIALLKDSTAELRALAQTHL